MIDFETYKNIRKEKVEIGGKSGEELITELEASEIKVSDEVKCMMRSAGFVPCKDREKVTLISLTVADLGFSDRTTTDEVFRRAQELGLALCSADTGPCYRLQYTNQPLQEWLFVAMKPIISKSGEPQIFTIQHMGGGLLIDVFWASSKYVWDLGNEFIFRMNV